MRGGDLFRMPITVTLFIVILSLTFSVSGVLIYYGLDKHRAAALIAAGELMERSSAVVKLRMTRLIEPIDMIIALSKDWPEADDPPTLDGHAAHQRFLSYLKQRPQIASIYLGFDSGDFYLFGMTRDRPVERLKQLNAPDEAVYLEQVILRSGRDTPLTINRFIGASGDVLAIRKEVNAKFDPRQRPWFKTAAMSDSPVRSDVYMFRTKRLGLTVSQRHHSGVVGIDLTLSQIEQFLSAEPLSGKGVLAIMDENGQLFGRSRRKHPDSGMAKSEEADFETLTKLRQTIEADPAFRGGLLTMGNAVWATHVTPIQFGAGAEDLLVVAVPFKSVVGEIARIARETVIVSLILVVISIPLIWLVTRRLSRPLQELSHEADLIRRFDLSGRLQANSHINEIRALQDSVVRMRSSLRTFALYVPKALVRRFIDRDDPPRLGGSRRFVTILFTDMEQFTDMSEGLEPEVVMARMSDYFEVITQILLEHGATIDKYIGDAVMAIWNAPDETPDHVALACKAAIAIRDIDWSKVENWRAGSITAPHTRIGIHCGDAVIGNVGSSDRMNYTALGATVNLAARLESYNQETGTDILVSAEVANRLGERFRFESAGAVSLKGISEPVEVYGLDREV